MNETLTFPRHRARPGANGGSGALRRLLAVPVLGLLTAGMLLLISPALALAQTTLTVVGTSDVSDSGLIPNLVKPEFQAAYPQYTLNYVGSATGVAIQSAESGNGSPSALIVHAASLENQFVGGGYSYKNQYGNAIFTNDFVLAGPNGDPPAMRRSLAAAGRTPRPARPSRSTRSGLWCTARASSPPASRCVTSALPTAAAWRRSTPRR
jgi:hypothetical protein